jgi:putative flippase GtrA
MMRKHLSRAIGFATTNRVAKYVLVSGGLTVLGMAVVYVFIKFLSIDAFWSSALSDFLCGTLQFMLLRNYIFDGHTTHGKTMLQYIVYCANWIFALFAVAFMFVWFLSVSRLIFLWDIISIPFAKGVAMLIMFIWNYNFHKYVTYRIK